MTLDIKKNITLAPLTTFGIGGEAEFFADVGSVNELTEAVNFAKDNKLPIFILGGGSNILVSDDGFDGLVIKMGIKGIEYRDTSGGVILMTEAGEMWDDVVTSAVRKGLWGVENLSLIPGTVGGAVYQNIGAYGVEIKDVLMCVKAYDLKTGNVIELSNKECSFEYRSSVFKKKKNLIVLKANMLLSKDSTPNVSYTDLMVRFKDKNPDIYHIRNTVIEIRRSKIPYPDEIGNAGSFFKNPVVTVANYQLLVSKYSDLKGKDVGGELIKLSAAQLIEKTGWKGKRVGNVGVADKHALVLVNYGGGTAGELTELETKIKKNVMTKFNVELIPEVEKVS